MQKLTGKWNCEDGGVYELTQVGTNLYWYGHKDNWANAGFGVINEKEQTVAASWADCPFNTGNHGTCFLDVSEEGKIKKIAGNFAFGVGNFTKAN